MAAIDIGTAFVAGDAIVASAMNTRFTGIKTWADGDPTISATTNTTTIAGLLTVTEALTASSTSQFNGTVTVGEDGTGKDVKFFGDTATNGYMLWDESTDDLILGTASKLGIGTIAPSDKLHVADAVTTISGTQIWVEGRYNGYGAGISFVSATTNGGTLVEMAKITADGEAGWDTTAANQDAGLRFFTTLNGTSAEKMRINASGQVGIGITPTGTAELSLHGGLRFTATASEADIYTGIGATGSDIAGICTGGTERLRCDSTGAIVYGQLDVGGVVTTTAFTPRISTIPTVGGYAGFMTAPSGDGTYAAIFENAAGASVGSIYCNASATAFNESSDYRLKENVVPTSAAMQRVNALKPVQFNFINEPDETLDGFIAHEVAEVVPQAVTGEKDAMRTIPAGEAVEAVEGADATYDDDGNELTPAVLAVAAVEAVAAREVILPQGLDKGKLVPLLTAAIQELDARLAAVEAA